MKKTFGYLSLFVFDLFLLGSLIIFITSYKTQSIFDFTGVIVLGIILFAAFLGAFSIIYLLTKELIKSLFFGILNTIVFFIIFLVVTYIDYKVTYGTK